jgi:hypothetical protein
MLKQWLAATGLHWSWLSEEIVNIQQIAAGSWHAALILITLVPSQLEGRLVLASLLVPACFVSVTNYIPQASLAHALACP